MLSYRRETALHGAL